MMNKIFFVLIIIINPIEIKANDSILSQGDAVVTFKDLDGYTYHKIPADKRAGFYESYERVNQTLMTLLNMKLLVNYSNQNNIIDIKELNSNVSNKLLNIFSGKTKNRSMSEEIRFLNVVEYIRLEEFNLLIKKHIVNSIKDSDVKALSEEYYILNRESFNIKENRNIIIMNVKYDNQNKIEKKKMSDSILKKLNTSSSYEDVIKLYSSHSDVVIDNSFEHFEFNDKYTEFSEFVFSSELTGVINSVFDAKDKFVIAIVKKINPARYQTFKEAKQGILTKLKTNKYKNEYNDLITRLSQFEIKINEENLLSLRNRYSK